MREVFVEAENGSYAIKIERGLLPRLGAELKEMGISRAAVVTDETVNALYGAAAENFSGKRESRPKSSSSPPGNTPRARNTCIRFMTSWRPLASIVRMRWWRWAAA